MIRRLLILICFAVVLAACSTTIHPPSTKHAQHVHKKAVAVVTTTSMPPATTITTVAVPVTTTTVAPPVVTTTTVAPAPVTAPPVDAYDAWTKVAVCEEGGWIGYAGPAYPDSLGIDAQNWYANGGGNDVSPAAQIAVAERLTASLGMSGWVPDQNGCASW